MTIDGMPIMNSLLRRIAGEVRRFLEPLLSEMDDNWWARFVEPRLSVGQYEYVRRLGPGLGSLDLAGLLKIMDTEWSEVEARRSLLKSDRNYLKEMFSIRNRWAHEPAESPSAEDLYRDLDTVDRFARMIHADDAVCDTVKEYKRQVTAAMAGSPPPPAQPAVATGEPPTGSGPAESSRIPVRASATTECATEATLSVGQVVCLRSDPSTRGVVTAVVSHSPELRYEVFRDSRTMTYYATQLLLVGDDKRRPQPIPLDRFRARLSAIQINHPNSSTLYSLNAARIDFIAYQFRPVLKFIRADRPRLLIADGVGVGKTIEAGLILRELEARGNVNSVLVICPKALITERKWEWELRRFDERFLALDSRTLQFCLDETHADGVWPEQYRKAILPYSVLDFEFLHGEKSGGRKRRRGLLQLSPPPRFDLVIVDEAHHVRNPKTARHQAVRAFCEQAEAVLFLTATPVQMGSDDLFNLLNLLRPDLVMDKESFAHMAEPNGEINRGANLTRAGTDGWQAEARSAMQNARDTAWGRAVMSQDPEFARVLRTLEGDPLEPRERVELIRDIEGLHTFAGLLSRTRRRDIGDFTTRKPVTVEVAFTDDQRALHDEIVAFQAEVLREVHGDANVNFMLSTLRRQVASSVFGLLPLLESILGRHLHRLLAEEGDEIDGEPEAAFADTYRQRLRGLLSRAESLAMSDPKLEALLRIVREKDGMSNRRLMVFSTFRHTLAYLEQALVREGVRVGLVHGGTAADDRVALRERFRLETMDPRAVDVLLFSEVGSEGLDYQFCDGMVNYDLPWNPMRIEQRIGRIDRWGQRSETVVIWNLVTPGTVDHDIYERCLMRLGIFERSVGASEEILGEISQEIRAVAENFRLTPREQRDRLQQISDNKIRLVQEQERLEERSAELLGIRVPQQQVEQEVEAARSSWLAPAMIENLVRRYLAEGVGLTTDPFLGPGPIKTLRLAAEARQRLLSQLAHPGRFPSSVRREWEDWLRGADPTLFVTFEAPDSGARAQLLTAFHPLVRQAATFFDQQGAFVASLRVEGSGLNIGTHVFALYQWEYLGLRPDVALRVVAGSPEIEEELPAVIVRAESADPPESGFPGEDVEAALEARHYLLWTEARAAHREQTARLCEHRRESLRASHAARTAQFRAQMEVSADERISRMKESQLAAAQADYTRRMEEIGRATEQCELSAQLLAYGVLTVSS
jgi:ATP-dependent helicase HepA